MSALPPLSRSRWSLFPWVVAGTIIVVIGVNGLLFWFARTTFPGVAATKPYEVGVAYNGVLDGAERQAATGRRLIERIDGGRINVQFLDREERPLRGFEITGRLARPVGPEDAVALSFQIDAEGVFRGEPRIPAAGQWSLTLVARRAGEADFVATRRIVVP